MDPDTLLAKTLFGCSNDTLLAKTMMRTQANAVLLPLAISVMFLYQIKAYKTARRIGNTREIGGTYRITFFVFYFVFFSPFFKFFNFFYHFPNHFPRNASMYWISMTALTLLWNWWRIVVVYSLFLISGSYKLRLSSLLPDIGLRQ